MPYPPELELVDQLLGGSLSLAVVCGFFGDETHARRALTAFVSKGVVVLSDESGDLPMWRFQEILRNVQPLTEYTKLRVAVTEKGAKAFETGGWDSV